MKPSHTPLRSTPPNLDRLSKLEQWTEQPLREALGEGAEPPLPVVVAETPVVAHKPASEPESVVVDDDLDWIAPPKPVARRTYSLNLPADLHNKLKKLSEKTGESMNQMIVRGAEREYERIVAALKKAK